jgi:hypothetical protein
MEMILKLMDGGITEISSDQGYENGGCETCDYGSVYVDEFIFYLSTGTIYIEASQSYGYALSEGYMMKTMLSSVDTIKEMTEREFYEWLETKLDNDLKNVITRYEWRDKK